MRVTSNVIDLMVERISRLPADSRDVLKFGACIGEHFDLQTIAVISGKPAEDILVSLNRAVDEGYLKFVDNIYSFCHDRILEAAYSIIPEDERSRIHYIIGKSELEDTSAEKLTRRFFISRTS